MSTFSDTSACRSFTISCLALAIVLVFSRGISGQVISGRVLDAESGEGLVGVSVYLAETTVGAATDGQGRFSIQPGGMEGFMTIVASMVGYQADQRVLNLAGSNSEITFRLTPLVLELEAATVEAKEDKSWQRLFSRFERQLLGSSRAGRDAAILNPYAVDVWEKDRRLHATAKEPLRIQNPRLGYELSFVLRGFETDRRGTEVQYSGLPFFVDLIDTEPAANDEWLRNRAEAYEGSLRHFLVALVEDGLEEDGFRMSRRRVSMGWGNQTMTELEPVYRDEVLGPSSIEGTYWLEFLDDLVVSYRSRSVGEEASWIRLTTPSAEISRDGWISPLTPIETSGAFSEKRLADIVPREYYQPEGTPPLFITTEYRGSHFPQDPGFVWEPERRDLRDAVSVMRERDWKRADRLLDNLIDQEEGGFEARYYRGICNRELSTQRTIFGFEQWREGMDDFDFILSRDSTYRDILLQKAWFYRIPTRQTGLEQRSISLDEAIALAIRQVAIDPDNGDNIYFTTKLFDRLLGRMNPDRAVRWCDEHPSDFAELTKARALIRSDEYRQADRILGRLQRDPGLLPVHPILITLATSSYAQGEEEEGEEYLEEAIEAIEQPSHAAFLFELIKHIVSQEELDEYAKLNRPSQMRQFFRAFWAKRNPLPASESNPRLAEHFRRLRVAEKKYYYDGIRSWQNNPDKTGDLILPPGYYLNTEFEDRGVIYLRLGEPSERISTVGGQPNFFKSSLGVDGQETPFLKDQSLAATWVPNESWRYSSLGLDFHFVVDEGSATNNWQLTPVVTNKDMVDDRMHWGGYYLAMARVAQSADLDKFKNLRSGTGLPSSDGTSVGDLDTDAMHSFQLSVQQAVDKGVQDAAIGLTADRHTWREDFTPMTFPVVVAAFRGDSGSRLLIYYELPALGNEVGEEDEGAEVGIALHDAAWNPVYANTTSIKPRDARISMVRGGLFEVAPDSYHVAIQCRTTKSNHLGAYKISKVAPSFSETQLMVSDVLTGFGYRGKDLADPELEKFVVNPSGIFQATEPLHVYFEIYQLTFGEDDLTNYSVAYALEPTEERRGLLRLRSRDDNQSLSFSSVRKGDSTSETDVGEVDISGVPPGKYTLRITVTDNNTGASVETSTPVEIIPHSEPEE